MNNRCLHQFLMQTLSKQRRRAFELIAEAAADEEIPLIDEEDQDDQVEKVLPWTIRVVSSSEMFNVVVVVRDVRRLLVVRDVQRRCCRRPSFEYYYFISYIPVLLLVRYIKKGQRTKTFSTSSV